MRKIKRWKKPRHFVKFYEYNSKGIIKLAGQDNNLRCGSSLTEFWVKVLFWLNLIQIHFFALNKYLLYDVIIIFNNKLQMYDYGQMLFPFFVCPGHNE